MILYFMIMHKDIIVRLIFSFIFIAITFRVLGPIFMDYLKKKMPGQFLSTRAAGSGWGPPTKEKVTKMTSKEVIFQKPKTAHMGGGPMGGGAW